jgi:hypothetical protein
LALKTIDIEYKNMENPQVLNEYNLAQNACSNYNTGMEGVLRTTFSFVFDIFTVVGYITILTTLNIFIVFALIVFTILNYLIKKHMVK